MSVGARASRTHRRRWTAVALLLALAAVLAGAFGPASASTTRPLSFRNPLADPITHKPLSCPDPSVTRQPRGPWLFFMVCTSHKDRDAFPIRKSKDLVHWYSNGYIFPRGKEPWWAVKTLGGGRNSGIFWAPSVYRIQNHWVVYFAAQYDNASHALPNGLTLPEGTMVIGTAWSYALAGPWHSSIVHWRGQFNGVQAEQEREGGSIDPGVVRDRQTGQLYLVWADQQQQIWGGQLSADGLALTSGVHQLLGVSERWECDPPNNGCTIEGPEPFYARGRYYLMYSGANTWDGSYAVGVASASSPMGPYTKLDHPILKTGSGFIGAGRASHPVIGPDGRQYILYHALLAPTAHHVSSERILLLGRFDWSGSWPLLNQGRATISQAFAATQ
jgi:arabinan endo-1,5-alpha-L-arabinosidase